MICIDDKLDRRFPICAAMLFSVSGETSFNIVQMIIF